VVRESCDVEAPLRYRILSSDSGPRTVINFVSDFERRPKAQAQIAWNGGYILNAELVGKLGLPESYIGSPLGLIISDGQVLSPPLYNKPAFMVDHAGSLAMRRVTCGGSLGVVCDGTQTDFAAGVRNPEQPDDGPCYYDLLFSDERLPGDGRTLVRLASNRIMEMVETTRGQSIPVFPVGLVLSFAPGTLPAGFEPGAILALHLPELDGIAQAVEAGPLLIDDGTVCIDMETEGWKTQNSIRTQAARLDYLDMRGPKIAAGLDDAGRLTVLTVNGRIRESVGATHVDMAEILRDHGLTTAMGFDPGGSSTLVVGGTAVNISPYNHAYEDNIFSLPPEPRAVLNVVLGYRSREPGPTAVQKREGAQSSD
jgi:exopolysaccharide biosynthesis protein